MKNFTNKFKQLTSRLSARWLIMALMLLVGTSSVWGVTTYTIYLKPNADWKKDGARFAVYLYGNGEKWLSMTSIDGTYYKVTTPDDKSYPYIIFCRMNGGTSTNNWNNKWNQTSGDNAVSTPSKSGQCYVITGWDNSGNWGTQYCESPSQKTVSKGTNDNNVKISGSQQGFTYTLYNQNGTAVGNTITGSGTALEWTVTDADTYTVKAKPTGSTCAETAMSGSYTYDPCTTCCTEYYVAGISNWNADADIMSCDNNIWSKKFTDKDADNYEFKVTNGNWNTDSDKDNEWSAFDNSKGNITCSGGNGSNIRFTTTSKGDITISFDGSKAWVDFEQPCYSSSDVEPGTISSNATNNTICGSGTVELTLSNTTTKDGLTKSIQWQKQSGSTWSNINNAESTTYTAENLSATTTYRAKVTWTKTGCDNIVEYANEGGFTVTVNPIPTAPTFTTNLAQVCSGVAFNLNEKFPRNSGEAGTLTWYKASDNSQVSDPASVTITESTSYYAKATNNNCTSDKSLNCTVNVDANPTLELASTPTVCPNVEIDLDNYVNPSTIGTVTWYYDDNRANVITDGLVTPTERTTYYAKVTNGTCNPVENEFTVDVYGTPDEMPAYTSTPATSCKGSPNSGGSIVINNAIGGISYKLDGVGPATEWSGLAAGTHKLSATVDACSSLTREWDIKVGEEDITPSATVTISGETSFCEGTSTELTCVVNATKGNPTAYQWYNGENAIQDETGTTYTATAAGNYKVVVTVLNSTCPDEFWSDEKVVTINPKPNEPVLSIPSPICAGSNFTLPEEDNNQRNITWNVNDRELTNLTAGTHNYTAKIIDVNGCESNEVTYTIIVTALPEITSISQDVQEPVFYEDVTLTAEATDGAIVKWYEGGVEKGEGLTYVVTSETATSKTITAKAFLNGCESAVASHPVTFAAEDCSNSDVTIESTKIEIWCRETGSSQAGSNLTCYAWYKKDESNHELNSDNTNKGTKTSVTKTSNIEGQEYTYRVWEFDMQNYGDYDVYVIFKKSTTAWDWQTSDLKAGKRNNRYFFTYDGSQNEQSKRGEIYSKSESLSVTTKTITAPAVKTVSVNSEQGSGVVNFTGKIIKTGCAAENKIYYGYQYRLETEGWPTTGVQAGNDKLQLKSLTNTSETALHYEFSSGDINLDDGNYVFRAYIINGYNFTNGNYDQGVYYGIDIPVTVSTKKYPIENLQVKYADVNGDVLQDQNVTYCVGDNAYIKLIYDGSRLKPEEDEINISSTLENTFTLVEGKADLYTFVVKGNETITVNAKNEENTVQGIDPATNSIDISTYVQPHIPSITLPEEMAVVCSNGVGATIIVNEPQEGITYSLYRDGVAEAAQTKIPTEGTLQFTEIKTAGTYYVTAVNPSCPNNIAKSLDSKSIEVIDASANTIAIEPDEDITNPWVPVKLKVTKNSVYDYTLVCKQGVTDVTESVVINKKDDIYTIKFPKPESAEIDKDGQVVFDDIEYSVTVSLNGNVECGVTSATSTVTLTKLIENCD